MGWINLILSVRVLREQISMFIIRTYLLAGIGVASRAETDPQGVVSASTSLSQSSSGIEVIFRSMTFNIWGLNDSLKATSAH